MTDKDKKIMVRLCTKLLQYVDFDEDKEAEKLIDWVVTQHSVKENNTKIRNLIGEYRHNETERRKQQELKHQLWQLEQELL